MCKTLFAKFEIIFTVYLHKKTSYCGCQWSISFGCQTESKVIAILFFCGVFYDDVAISSRYTALYVKMESDNWFCRYAISYCSGAVIMSQCIASSERIRVNNELERAWKQLWHNLTKNSEFSGVLEQKCQTPVSGEPI